MFSVGVYFKVWNVTNKGNYSEVECSTSKKNRQTDQYETDFSNKFVRFVGNAHQKCPQPNERIKVTSCGVENVYIKDGQRQYMKNPTFIVFDFERDNATGYVPPATPNVYMPSAYSGNTNGFQPLETANESDLPF